MWDPDNQEQYGAVGVGHHMPLGDNQGKGLVEKRTVQSIVSSTVKVVLPVIPRRRESSGSAKTCSAQNDDGSCVTETLRDGNVNDSQCNITGRERVVQVESRKPNQKNESGTPATSNRDALEHDTDAPTNPVVRTKDVGFKSATIKLLGGSQIKVISDGNASSSFADHPKNRPTAVTGRDDTLQRERIDLSDEIAALKDSQAKQSHQISTPTGKTNKRRISNFKNTKNLPSILRPNRNMQQKESESE